MLRYKSNKQALTIAVLIILLCFVSLTGATYAFFTSNLNDGTIGIITTAGEVKIDIVDAEDETVSLVGEVLEFQTQSNKKAVLFEPGATFYTQGFKVKNEGNITVNFHLSVSEDEKIDMDEFHRAFEVWISTTPDGLHDAKKLTDFKGQLKADACSKETYYLFIRMRETVGNEFQGKSYTGIGVTVYAVQGNVDIKE